MAFCLPQRLSNFLNGFPLSKKSEKIYLRWQVSKRLLFELRISCHLLSELCNSRYNVYISPNRRVTAMVTNDTLLSSPMTMATEHGQQLQWWQQRWQQMNLSPLFWATTTVTASNSRQWQNESLPLSCPLKHFLVLPALHFFMKFYKILQDSRDSTSMVTCRREKRFCVRVGDNRNLQHSRGSTSTMMCRKEKRFCDRVGGDDRSLESSDSGRYGTGGLES